MNRSVKVKLWEPYHFLDIITNLRRSQLDHNRAVFHLIFWSRLIMITQIALSGLCSSNSMCVLHFSTTQQSLKELKKSDLQYSSYIQGDPIPKLFIIMLFPFSFENYSRVFLNRSVTPDSPHFAPTQFLVNVAGIHCSELSGLKHVGSKNVVSGV